MVEMQPNIQVVPREVVPTGHVATTPNEASPYKVVFLIGDRVISEHPVGSMRDGEALIRVELPNVCVSARDPSRDA